MSPLNPVLPSFRATPPSAHQTGSCPRCQAALTDPDGLGLCAACGYCRSREDARNRAASDSGAHSRLGVGEFWHLLTVMPGWVYVLVAGVLAVLIWSVAANAQLEEASAQRAYLGAGQLGVGLLFVLLAQYWAMRLVPAGEGHGRPEPVFSLVRLWRGVWHHLPETRGPLHMVAWGGSLALCAILVIGGFGWWLKVGLADEEQLAAAEKARARKDQQRPTGPGRTGSNPLPAFRPPRPRQTSLNPSAPTEELFRPATTGTTGNTGTTESPNGSSKPQPGEKPDRREVAECFVFGYLTNDKDELSGLVLGTLRDGRKTFAGVVRRGFSASQAKVLLARLSPLRQEAPDVAGLTLKALWVKPELFCEVQHASVSADGVLADPVFKAIIDD